MTAAGAFSALVAVALVPAVRGGNTKAITLGPSATRRFSLTHGVDRGPDCDYGASIASELHELSATLIRTHDEGSLDWCVLFPNITADPDDPANYDWAAGDAYFSLIINSSFAPYFRIGSSWNIPFLDCIRPDPSVFARVAVRTIQHYNDGSFGGGFSGKKIAFIEIGNEPDGPRFWNLTAPDFYTLFDKTARALKAYDPSLRVGGPGVSNPVGAASRPYNYGFLDFVAAAGTPLDFFSWHYYGYNELAPENNYLASMAAVRAYLGLKGLGAVKQHITEWAGAILGDANLTRSPQAAAYVGAALTYMAQAPDLEVATYYPGCEGSGPDGSWGLFETQTNGTVDWRRQARAFAAVGATLRDAPFELPATFAAETDYAVLAGADAAAAARLVSVVVSASASAFNSFNLTLALPGAAAAAVSVYVLDAGSEGTWANATVPVVDGAVSVLQSLAPPAVAWVLVRSL